MKRYFFVMFVIVALFVWGCAPHPLPQQTSTPSLIPNIIVTPSVTISPTVPSVIDPVEPIAMPFQGVPDNLIVFALDESVSVSTTNCPLSSAQYDIPNLFIPLFQQYYDESLVGSSSQSKYAPWLEVIRWPFKRDAIPVTRASDLDLNFLPILPSPNSSDAFFDEVFKYFYELSNVVDKEKLQKRTLIFFTDGSFQGGADYTGVDFQSKAIAELEKIDKHQQDVDFDIHVVLLCPKEIMSEVDYNWWIAKAALYPSWFHLYEKKDTLSLARSLWVNVFNNDQSKLFPFPWNNDRQGVYLVSEDGYWDLNSGSNDEIKSFESCKTYELNNHCIGFSFSADATGLYSGVVTLKSDVSNHAFIWKDDWIEKFPEEISDPRVASWYKVWDNKVTPINDCTKKHSWVFNPRLVNTNSPALFWWRAASDAQLRLLLEEKPVFVFWGGEDLDKKETLMPVGIQSAVDFIPLRYISPCYEIDLSVDGHPALKKKITVESNSEGQVSWDLKTVLTNLYPDIASAPVNTDLVFQVKLQILDVNGSVVGDDVNVEIHSIYFPTFLASQYEPCTSVDAAGNLVGGNFALSSYKCIIKFKYVTGSFFSSQVKNIYQPFFYLVNKQGEKCSGEISINYDELGGGKITVSPLSDDYTNANQEFEVEISDSFFNNDSSENCSDIETMSFEVVWRDWGELNEDLPPQSWRCEMSTNNCSPISYSGE